MGFDLAAGRVSSAGEHHTVVSTLSDFESRYASSVCVDVEQACVGFNVLPRKHRSRCVARAKDRRKVGGIAFWMERIG